MSARIPPIERSIIVSWDPPTAFHRFTAEFSHWWPRRTHSIGGPRVAKVVFEPGAGGRIYEEHLDGRRFQWGLVLAWDPPRMVKFAWHPSRDPSTAQTVELRFEPANHGTRLTLIASDWEKWGPHARRARRGYDLGWNYVLQVWAGRRTSAMALLDRVATIANWAQRFRGGTAAAIERAGGELPRT
jgi:hypothetical protein